MATSAGTAILDADLRKRLRAPIRSWISVEHPEFFLEGEIIHFYYLEEDRFSPAIDICFVDIENKRLLLKGDVHPPKGTLLCMAYSKDPIDGSLGVIDKVI
jgi:hypothetical protein